MVRVDFVVVRMTLRLLDLTGIELNAEIA